MPANIPSYARHLLNFIGDIEAPRGYDTIYGNNQRYLAKPLTTMTISEIIAVQPTWTKKYGSSACGRYQFMRKTLQELVKEAGLSGEEKFTKDLQDQLAYRLLRRRGYDDYIVGDLSTVEFGKKLAQEWASLPVLAPTKGAHRQLKRGQSFYTGDALNKSLVTPERVEAALDMRMHTIKVAEPATIPVVDSAPPKKPEGKPSAMGLFSRLLQIFTRGVRA